MKSWRGKYFIETNTLYKCEYKDMGVGNILSGQRGRAREEIVERQLSTAVTTGIRGWGAGDDRR